MPQLDPSRKRRLETTLENILTALKERYHPQQVILFGSLASGQINSTSDLDLLIVKDTDKGFYARLREVVSLCDYDIGVDFLVYTPSEFLEQSRSSLFFQQEILSKGKVIYRAPA